MARRFAAGQRYVISGLTFRVVPGAKAPNDLRLDVAYAGGIYRPVRMSLGAFLADYFYENEAELYPPPALGGDKYLAYLARAARDGWREADEVLRREQTRRRV